MTATARLPKLDAPSRIPDQRGVHCLVGVGVLPGFTGIFPVVLAFSLLLAVLCLFCGAGIRRTV